MSLVLSTPAREQSLPTAFNFESLRRLFEFDGHKFEYGGTVEVCTPGELINLRRPGHVDTK